jgi:antitoxin component YwqK of YwqJK toxin-antitoxin module
MKKIYIILLFIISFISTSFSQVYNEKDSTYYSDSSYVKVYNGTMIHFFEESNKMKSQISIIDGKWHGEKTDYYESGEVERKTTYINGVPHGTTYVYHENGALQGQTSYENGELNGDWLQYHPNGKILGKGKYLKGLIHGETIWYDPEGNVSNFYKIELKW